MASENNKKTENAGESSKATPKPLKPGSKIVKNLAKKAADTPKSKGKSNIRRIFKNKKKFAQAGNKELDSNSKQQKDIKEPNSKEENKEKVIATEKNEEKGSKGERKETLDGSDKSRKIQKRRESLGGSGIKRQDRKEKGKLGGLIFMCNAKTKPDCFRYRVMALPMAKKDLVMSIRPGLKLFLYDFDLRLLYGVYEASSSGGMKLEPAAFNGAFPVQVRFAVHRDCYPLPEHDFKSAIEENYNQRHKFDPELTPRQVRKLQALFRRVETPQTAQPVLVAVPPPIPQQVHERPRESVLHSSREQGKDRYANGEDRRYPVPHEVVPTGGRDLPRDSFMSEHEYRTHGLRRERLNVTPPRNDAPVPRVSDAYLSNLERDPLLRRDLRNPSPPRVLVAPPPLVPLEPQRSYIPEDYLRRPPPGQLYREASPIRKEPEQHKPPPFLNEREYRAYALGGAVRELAPPTAPAVATTADPYAAYRYAPTSVALDPYYPALRREEVASRESYQAEVDRLRRRESDAYASSALLDYPRAQVPYHAAATEPAPVSSRYSFAGPSLYRR